ncbi:MAG: hypothetical protein ACPGVV_10980 [Croceimicrobium sp.]
MIFLDTYLEGHIPNICSHLLPFGFLNFNPLYGRFMPHYQVVQHSAARYISTNRNTKDRYTEAVCTLSFV